MHCSRQVLGLVNAFVHSVCPAAIPWLLGCTHVRQQHKQVVATIFSGAFALQACLCVITCGGGKKGLLHGLLACS
jgi:hypothetical protein